ncbi:MAG TPA: hypothetical protein VN799_06580 [Acidimicrobiales bacterium]|nr:hypothetical protein [Acidimicrobiales bacterium]
MVSLDSGARLAGCAVPERVRHRVSSTDIIGGSLAVGSAVAACAWLIEGLVLGWPLWTWLVFVLAPVNARAFWHYEAYLVETGRQPLLDPSYFEPPLH